MLPQPFDFFKLRVTASGSTPKVGKLVDCADPSEWKNNHEAKRAINGICIHRVSRKICILKFRSLAPSPGIGKGCKMCSGADGSAAWKEEKKDNNSSLGAGERESIIIYIVSIRAYNVPPSIIQLLLERPSCLRSALSDRNKDVIAIQFVMGLRGAIFSTTFVCMLLILIND